MTISGIREPVIINFFGSSSYNEMNLAQLNKQFHYNAVMKAAILHLRDLPHRLFALIFDCVNIIAL